MNKKRNLFKRALSGVLAASVVSSGMSLPTFASGGDDVDLSVTKVSNSRISAKLTRDAYKGVTLPEPMYSEDENVRVSIVLEGKSTIERGFPIENIGRSAEAAAVRETLKAEQDVITADIERATGETLDVKWNLTLAANIISANVKFGQIETIKRIDGVKDVVVEKRYEPQVLDTELPLDPNMSTSSAQIGSNAAWTAGYTGAGSRIAIIDSGIDYKHRSFNDGALMWSFEQNAKQNGLDKDKYIAGLDLLDKDEVAALADQLNIKADPNKLYLNAKIPFAYNYVDGDYNTEHEPGEGQGNEHGSHVAGIAAANAWVESEEGGCYKEALNEVSVKGVAPDAQLFTMKVFGKNGGANDSDYMAAIEDAIVLGADSINLSIGSGNPGDSRYINPTEAEKVYQGIMDNLTKTGVVVCISSGNSGYWAEMTPSGALYIDDVSMQTDGSPGSYTNALTVASVNNSGTTGEYFTVSSGEKIFFNPASGTKPLTDLADKPLQYVLLDGIGTEEDWTGADLTGKIAVCARGETTFAEKANIAGKLGAAGIIIYNNQAGTINMASDGYEYADTKPMVSITLAEGITMLNAATQDANGFYNGTLTVSKVIGSKPGVHGDNTMSDFSSWGVPGSLELKPEITAPGGNIYSVFGSVGTDSASADHKSYVNMDGTSMASPQVAGMTAVVAQYIREKGLDKQTGLSARILAQSLLMSTAEPVIDGSSFASVLQQGAGVGNVGSAVTADTYVMMGADATKSYADGKVKVELGDDPDKKGEYSFSFTLNNLTNDAKEYNLYAYFFTQENYHDVFMLPTTTPLTSTAEFTVDGAKTTVATVPAGKSVTVKVSVKLNDADRTALAAYPNGAYIEGFVCAIPPVAADDTMNSTHTIPVLGFYGSWSEPSMFDAGTLVEYLNEEIDINNFPPYLVEKTYISSIGLPYTNFFTVKYPDIEMEALGNPYNLEPYDENRNAINSTNGSKIGSAVFTAIRNAANSRFTAYDATTNKYLFNKELGPVSAAFYYTNKQDWYYWNNELAADFAPVGAAEGDKVIFSLTLAPEYYMDNAGNVNWDALKDGASMSIPFTVDNTAPEILSASYNKDSGILTVKAKDNQYLAAVIVTNKAGTAVIAKDYSQPEAKPGDECTYTFDLGTELSYPNVLVKVADYAMNETTYLIKDAVNVKAPAMMAVAPVSNTEDVWASYDCTTNALNYLAPNASKLIAATNADHIIFAADEEGNLYAAPDNDVTDLTLVNNLGVAVTDLAYNTVDGYLYGVTPYNSTTSLLFDIDKLTGECGKNLIADIPFTDTLACDLFGNFYFNEYGTEYIDVYYPAEDKVSTGFKVDQLSDGTKYLQSMEWDNNRDLLCWTARTTTDNIYFEISFEGMRGDYVTLEDINDDGVIDVKDGLDILKYRVGEENDVNDANIADLDRDGDVDTYDAYLYLTAVESYGNDNGVKLVKSVQLPAPLWALVIPEGGDYVTPDWAKSSRPTSVSMSDEKIELIKGGTYQLAAYVHPWSVSDTSVVWSSSDTLVATVDKNGVVTAVGKGSCSITATSAIQSTVKASTQVTVKLLEATVYGALQDVDGQPTLYEWDLTKDAPEYTVPLKTSIASMTQDKNGDLYIMDASSYVVHKIDPTTGAEIDVGTNIGLPIFDMAYSDMLSTNDAPYVWGVYGNYFVGPMDPMDINGQTSMWTIKTLANVGARYFTAITNIGKTQITEDGEVYELEAYALIDDAGNIWIIECYFDEPWYISCYPSDLNVEFTLDKDLPYSSMVLGDDGNLYLAQFDGTTSNLYRLVFDENTESYVAGGLGNVGKDVWPAGIYSVKANSANNAKSTSWIDDVVINGIERSYDYNRQIFETYDMNEGIALAATLSEVSPAAVLDVTIPEAAPTAEAAPVTEETTPAAEETTPVSEETTPAAKETVPASEETAPAAEETAPVSEETAPAAEETVPVSEETTPATEETPAEPPVTEEPTTDGTLSFRVCEKSMMAIKDVLTLKVYPLTEGDEVVDSQNGLVVVNYDTEALELAEVNVRAKYKEVNSENPGIIIIGYVMPTAKGAPIADLTFNVKDKTKVTTQSVYAHYVETNDDNTYSDPLTDDAIQEIIAATENTGSEDDPYNKNLIDSRYFLPTPSRPSGSGSSGGSGGGSSGGSGGSGSGSHSSVTTPAKSGSGSEGWSAITGEINGSAAGSTVVVAVNDEHEIPVEVLKALAEHDVTLKVTVGTYTWVIDGAAMTTVPTEDVDLGILGVMVGIPTSAISEVDGVKFTFSVNESDAFGFDAKLMVDMGSANAGKTAKLYIYDAASGKLVEVSTAVIGADGMALFSNVTKGGKYAVAIAAATGDVNGDGTVNALDASDILKSTVNLITLAHPENGDTNGDGKVDSLDAVWVLKKIVGLV